uniref:Putative N-carbamoyl-D-amino acid amidohydrolase n=1 Tax=Aminobacter sp. DSM 24754 TaxID=1072665 RepID=L0NN31_9HYPH|nr:putative N-carbamoyl-D-amino acid amidohydrolase [Aminobacter sp. DSM 24754]
MARIIHTASAQMGPIAKSETRKDTVKRLIALMREAKARGAELVVFTELALTTFFPRWLIEDEAELDSYYERAMPGPDTQPLFDEAKKLGIGFYLGYAELVVEDGRKRRFNTSILVDRSGAIIGKYRKVHLPGFSEPQPNRAHQHLEKRYFEPGNHGFKVWRGFGGVMGMCICNDRRWPETYRVMGLQGVEMVMLGYNTPFDHTGHADIDGLTSFHNHLSMQAGAYQNATWVIGTAKCGKEEGSSMVGQSAIIAPSGEIVAQAMSLEDEIITARCDLDLGKRYRETIFNFAKHREPDAYRLIVERKGAVPPPEA